jgi:uncharacterized protein DUF4160
VIVSGSDTVDPMPTIPELPGPYRFFFYSFDCGERAHVHVRRESLLCKFWLRPPELARAGRFPARELLVIERLILQHLPGLEEAWDEHCGA